MEENTKINFEQIEKKWQDRWDKDKVFVADDNSSKKKWYVLEMYPYPSGSGLHMGHLFNYCMGDVFARLKKMQGYEVLHPMGYDSFGLPAENAAIKAKAHPKKFTEEAIKSFTEEFKRFGNSYDWNRMIESHDPKYYKWDQWIFLKMLEKGLAYRKKSAVNWCSKCNTVLANEQVQNGKCWRHEDTDAESKELEQWYFKTTEYADELFDMIDDLKEWPDLIKKLQKNWIQRKEWIDIDYGIEGTDNLVTVSTTRPDTNFGATFVVISPEHELLQSGIIPESHKAEVEEYVETAKKKSPEERMEEGRKKTGAFTGLYCINNLNGERMPLWVADFVLTTVGTGVVVGVPGHDLRDFEFAKEFDIPIKRVVVGKDGDDSEITKKEQVQEEQGTMINSDFLNGMDIHKATKKIMDYLEEKKWGRRTMRYRLRDWLVSRQRFWGTPIPVIYCDDCGAVPVPEKDLPVVLPDDVNFESVENPLNNHSAFVDAKCPNCNSNAKRETDTMDTFVNSSWYFLRFCDPHNENQIFDSKKVEDWMPVGTYIGGKEHACMHLIYARFYTKFLRDLGLLKLDEPFMKLFNQGYIYGEDGKKMSKSIGNVVVPKDAMAKYGVDASRLFVFSVASPEKDFAWSHAGADGSSKFVTKVVNYVMNFKEKEMTPLQESKLNRTIKDYTGDLENFKFNLGVIKLRQLFDILEEGCSVESMKSFVKMISPLCPHVAEELWEKLGGEGYVSLSDWPVADESKINDKLEQAEKNVLKTVEDIKNIFELMKEKTGKVGEKVYLYVIPPEKVNYDSKVLSEKIGKEVEIFAVNDDKKYDPENKSAKVKPGRPGIYIE